MREPGAEACPDEEQVRAAVAARLGYNPFSPEAPRTVTAAVHGAPRGLVAQIEIADALGEVNGARQLRSPKSDCAELSSALELAIALAIDPLSLMRGDPPGQDAATTSTATSPQMKQFADGPAGPPASWPADSPSPPPRRKEPPPGDITHVRGSVGAMATFGFAPSIIGAGVSLGLDFRQTLWSVAVELRGDLPTGISDGAGHVSTALAIATILACGHIGLRDTPRGRVELAACGLVGGGAQFGIGEGYQQNSQTTTPYVAIGGRAAFEVPLTRRLVFRAHADLYLPLLRLQVNVVDAGVQRTVFEAPFASGAVGAALLVYFR